MNDSRGAVALLVVVVAAVLYGRPGEAPAPPDTRARVEVDGKALARPTPTTVPGKAPPVANPDSVLGQCRDLDEMFDEGNQALGTDAPVEPLIATVPDPLDSHVGWFFDIIVDALERGVEDTGFLLQGYFLPWECTRETSAQKPRRAPHREAPGIIVLRSPDGRSRRVILLVGETPTTGIHVQAFRRAVCLATALRSPWPRPEVMACFDRLPASAPKPGTGPERPRAAPAVLHVIGPTFSGSAYSLDTELQRARTREPNVDIAVVSGTASAVDPTLLQHPEHGITFAATTVPSPLLQEAVLTYLHERGTDFQESKDMAVLSEGATSYGASYVKSHARVNGPRFLFRFPPHLSQIRTAYETIPKPLKTEDPASSLLPQPRSLSLHLDEQLAPRDAVPPLTPDLTAVDTDLVLSQILAEIARSSVRYLMIIATDPRDTLFLARKVHEYARDVRLVLPTESFLLYAHPDVRNLTEGALVVSSYPVWVRGHSPGFSSNLAEGVFNATLASLGQDGRLVDYDGEAAGEPPERRRVPPIWISVIAHDGLRPIKTYPVHDPGHYVYRASGPPRREEPEGSLLSRLRGGVPSHVVLLIVFLLSTAFFVNELRLCVLGIVHGRQPREKRRVRRSDAFLAIGDRQAPWDRFAWAILCCGPLVAVPALTFRAIEVLGGPPSETLFFFERAVDLSAGRSLLILVTLLVTLVYAIAFAHLRRIALSSTFAVHNPLTAGQPCSIGTRQAQLERMLRAPRRVGGVGILAFLGAIPIGVVVLRAVSFDDAQVDRALRAWLLVGYLGLTGTLILGVRLWWTARRLFVRVAHHPIAPACDRIAAAGLTGQLRRNLYSQSPALGTLEESVRRWEHLLATHPFGVPTHPATIAAVDELARAPIARATLDAERVPGPKGRLGAWQSRTKTLTEELARRLVPVLEANWHGGGTGPWLDAAEEFVALEVTASVAYFCTHIWNLLGWAAVAGFVLAFVLTSFPFEPAGQLAILGGVVILLIVAVTLIVLVQMERNPLLSRMSKTSAYEVSKDWTFARGVLLYAVLPLLGIVIGQVPQLASLFETATKLAH